jgi:PEP-CTERM motif
MRSTIVLAAMLSLLPASAQASNYFSFTGTLAGPNQVKFIDFTLAAPSHVTLQGLGYSGGVNLAGNMIAAGGFDSILSLFLRPSGFLLADNDDGGFVGLPCDGGNCYDPFISMALDAGDYRLSIQTSPNFAFGPLLSHGFFGNGTFNGRSQSWAVDLWDVDSASISAVPEPASWAMLIAGLGLTGAVMRRRRAIIA